MGKEIFNTAVINSLMVLVGLVLGFFLLKVQGE